MTDDTESLMREVHAEFGRKDLTDEDTQEMEAISEEFEKGSPDALKYGNTQNHETKEKNHV